MWNNNWKFNVRIWLFCRFSHRGAASPFLFLAQALCYYASDNRHVKQNSSAVLLCLPLCKYQRKIVLVNQGPDCTTLYHPKLLLAWKRSQISRVPRPKIAILCTLVCHHAAFIGLCWCFLPCQVVSSVFSKLSTEILNLSSSENWRDEQAIDVCC